MSTNPYESPVVAELSQSFDAPSVRVDEFHVNTSRFQCRSSTPAQLAATLREEIVAGCHAQELKLSENEQAAVHIVGAVHEVDEGSQFLRYMLPFLAGASLVHVEGEIRIRNEPPLPFKQMIYARFGAFGGRSDRLIQLALQRIGLFVASETARRVSPTAQQHAQSAQRYLVAAAAVALLVALTSAVAGYFWALGIPQTRNAIKPGEIPYWAVFVAVATFTTTILLAVAFAPSRVLHSRSLLWLVTRSGVKSLIAMRIILLILAAVAGGMSLLSFVIVQ